MSWGNNDYGKLGDGQQGWEGRSDVPVPVSGLSEVVAISAGAEHSLALLKNGTVMSWGGGTLLSWPSCRRGGERPNVGGRPGRGALYLQ